MAILCVINGKAGRTAVSPKFSDTLTLYQPGGGADYAHTLALPGLKRCDYAPAVVDTFF